MDSQPEVVEAPEPVATVVAPPVLTICLPTVTNRCDLFAKLHAHILAQCVGKPVEVIVACDAKEISIGKKRQNLLEQATGDWVVFIDDDDFVADNYVDAILAALTKNPDCVGFLISCTTNGKRPVKAKASMCYKQWAENVDGYAHVRSPYQKTPIRRSIALQAGFPDLRYGEDRIYSKKVVALVKTEVFVDAVLYHYKFRSEPFDVKYGIKPPPRQSRAPRTASGERVPLLDYKGRRVGWK